MNLYRGLKNFSLKISMKEQIKDLFHKNVWPFIQEQNLENKKLSIEIKFAIIKRIAKMKEICLMKYH